MKAPVWGVLSHERRTLRGRQIRAGVPSGPRESKRRRSPLVLARRPRIPRGTMTTVIDYRVLRLNEAVAQGSHGIDIAWIWELDRDLVPLLGHLLPYADTMFNSSQVHSLLAELDRLPKNSPLVPEVRDDLKRLCEITSQHGHNQLWFFGD